MRYFSYGSNMSIPRLQERVPSANKIGVARLTSHQLRFHKVSKKDGSGKCDAFNTNNAGDSVIGVLFEIAQEEKDKLDKKEGLGFGYEQQEVVVKLDDGATVSAFTYVATNIDETLKPLDWYKEHVIRGARENFLPESYIAEIEAMECYVDSDSERRDRELAIYR